MLILTTKLGVGGGAPDMSWQEQQDGSWCLEVPQGGCFGEAALLKGLVRAVLLLVRNAGECFARRWRDCSVACGHV